MPNKPDYGKLSELTEFSLGRTQEIWSDFEEVAEKLRLIQRTDSAKKVPELQKALNNARLIIANFTQLEQNLEIMEGDYNSWQDRD